jgi:hypothetical protein
MNKLDHETSRRLFLKGAGVAIALPMLESIRPLVAAGAERSSAAKAKRLVCTGAYLGYHRESIYPAQTGRGYVTSQILEPLQRHREEFTILSGLDHRPPKADGHGTWQTFLTGQTRNSISLDQLAAAEIGNTTRFQSLQLSAGKAKFPMNRDEKGKPLPMISRPSVLYRKLFAIPEDKERMDYILKSGRSALDAALDEAKRLSRTVSEADRKKLDEYFDSLREVERRVQKRLDHTAAPVPKTAFKPPEYDPIAPNLMIEAEAMMYDLMALALETDSSRVMTLFLGGEGQVFTIDGETLKSGYHMLSHHGNDPEKIAELVKVDREHMRCLANFLDQLKRKTDADGRPLLESTLLLSGTGIGDANAHVNNDLPTVVAGGGLKHGQHVRAGEDRLLGDLYITLLQQLGIGADRFSNATQNLNEVLL